MSEHHFFLSKRLLLKMLASYFVVALLPLLFSNLQYHQQTDKAIAQEKQDIAVILRQSRDRYDEAVAALDKVFSVALADSELLAVSNAVNPLKDKKNVYSYIRAQHRIYQIAKTLDLTDDLILYNIPEQFAITANTIFLKMELLPTVMESKYKGHTWPRELLSSLSVKERTLRRWIYLPASDGSGTIALYINTLYLKNNNNVILFLMTPEHLEYYLRSDSKTDIVIYNQEHQRLTAAPTYPVDDPQVCAVADSGTIIASDGERYLVSRLPSETTEHLVYSVTPYAGIESGVISLRNSNFIYFTVMLLCTLAICVAITWISTKPLDDMLGFLFGKDGVNVARALNWKTVDERIHAIFHENATLTDNLNTQHEYLRNYLIYDLINNGDSQSDRILTRLERLGIPVDDQYWLIVFEMPMQQSDQDPAALSLLVHKAVQYRFEDVFNISDMTAKRYVVLVRAREPVREQIERAFLALQQDIFDSLCVKIRGCICRVESLGELGRWYWDAAMSLELAWEENTDIIPVSEAKGDKLELQFPQRLEQQIISSVVSCNQALLEGALNELYDLNNHEHQMSAASAKLLWERVCATITIALMRAKDVPDALQIKTLLSLRNASEAENRYQFTHNALLALDSTFILTQKAANTSLHRSELGKKIVDYIQLHLTEPELCLPMVADHFHLSSTYVSALVKDETGINFSNYCEKLRIANACELLREGKQIQTVAEEVGYSSAHTFRRVFKKVVGVLPSQYS